MYAETSFRSEERFTQDEFRSWLEARPAADVNHYELIRGRIVMSPPARWRHGRVGARLSSFLERGAAEIGLGQVFDSSTGYELASGDTLEPDVSFVSTGRWSSLPRPLPEGFLPVAPDLVIEVLSPSTARRDFTEKKEIYAANGVDEYWIVDADRRRVTIFSRGGTSFDAGRIVTDGRVVSRVLPLLQLTIEGLFIDMP
jgi:Uma2 family endonuclease